MKKIIFFSILFMLLFAKSSFAKAIPWEHQATIQIPSDTTAPTPSGSLEEGVKYKITVSGTYDAGANITADAQCSYREGYSTEWTDDVRGYESHGETLLDLHVDGNHEWGDCNDEHEYSMVVRGDDNPLSLFIYDIYSSNNVGELTVDIYKFQGKVGKSKDVNSCATIQDGTIEYGRVGDPNPDIIPIGYDEWGYNYEAHMFNGMWCDYHPYYREGGAGHAQCLIDMADVRLMMKWSDEWLSNKDCNNDGKLDRGYSCDPIDAKDSGCPGAWLTNHERASYEEGDDEYKYNYFTKIVAAPEDAYNDGSIWYTKDGVEIGPVIWGAYATIQEVYNDQETGEHGVQYLSPAGPGFGTY